MHWPINSRNVYFYLYTYKYEIGINAHDVEFDFLYHMCVPVSSKDLNFYRHMPWFFCIQWVNMRGDGSFSRNLWNCLHYCLNFNFLSVYVNGGHITGSFWRCVSPISQTVDLCTIYTVLYLEFKECHQTMFFSKDKWHTYVGIVCLQIYLISWNNTLIHGLLSVWLLIRR
jgi:hypothetical protein